MSEVEWYQIAGTLASGGLAGAIASQLFSYRHNRVPIIGKKLNILPVIKSTLNPSGFKGQIIIREDGVDGYFGRLSYIQIQLINKSVKDFKDLSLGITMPENNKIIYIEGSVSDRHHLVSILTPASLSNSIGGADFTLIPFNRNDIYNIDMYVVGEPTSDLDSNSIVFSSANPLRFIDLPRSADLMRIALDSVLISFGPLKLTLSGRDE